MASFTVSPLDCWVQDSSNAADPTVVVCVHCGSFLGESSEEQLAVRGAPLLALCSCACELGCGALFCGKLCHDAAVRGWHADLCVGPHSEDHPLYRFKVRALTSEAGGTNTLLLAAKWLATTAQSANATSASLPWNLSASSPLWWELAVDRSEGEDGDEEEEEEERWGDVAHEVAQDTWAQLCKGSSERFAAAHSERSLEDWGKLLGYVTMASKALNRESPVVACCANAYSAGGGAALAPELAKEILARYRGAVLEEVESVGGEVEALTDERMLDRILADPSRFVSPFEAIVLCDCDAGVSHSCLPSHELRLAPAPAQTKEGEARRLLPELVALAADADASLRTVCFVDTEGDLEERTSELALLGLPPCNCLRCVFECWLCDELLGHDQLTLTTMELRRLLAAAQTEHRYDEAVDIISALLERDPLDGDALYERSRLAGWRDRWSSARRLLDAANALVPTHGRVSTAWRDSNAYYSGGAALPAPALHAEIPELESPEVFVAPGLLSALECAETVAAAERFLEGQWTTSRHFAVPTNDVPVSQVPTLLTWFNAQLETTLFPEIGRRFSVDPAALRIIDAFLVKLVYDASKQRSLPLHCDQSEFSLTISMNPSSEFSGGGTFFADRCEAINCDAAGGVVGFRGATLHGGYPVTSGIRYIIVVFAHAYRAAPEDGREDDIVG